MAIDESVIAARPQGMPREEWIARLELAACYRLFDWFGWTTLIYNHISLRVPGSEDQFLINPFGLNYEEVTARNLLRIDVQGNKLSDSPYPVNAAGFVIHSAVHAARADAHCIAHTHTNAGMAVACTREGLRHDNFNSAQLYGQVAYHDFEGVTTNPGEKDRLVHSLGNKPVLILRNHGLLVAMPSVAQMFSLMYTLQKACEVQVATDSLSSPALPVPVDVLQAIPAQNAVLMPASARPGQLVFDACLRKARIDYAMLAQ